MRPAEIAADHARHRLAEVCFHRLRFIRERAEHQPGEHFDAQRFQPMLRVVEILRHAALAANAVAERNALQPAREIVTPGMVNAGQRLRVAALLQAHKCSFVSAAIDQRVDHAMLVARDDDRCFTDGGETPVARIGNLNLQAQKIPDRPAEQPLLFLGVDLGIREHTEGHACHAALRPDQIACKIARHRDVHHWPPQHLLSSTTVAVPAKLMQCNRD